MASKNLDEKHQQILWNLVRSNKANNVCSECSQQGTTFVDVDHCVFVCFSCSGLHRELNHRIKGISMSKFSAEEIERIKRGGNEEAAKTWLANWDSRSSPKPPAGETTRIREFMKQKYISKRWYSASQHERVHDSQHNPSSSSSTAPPPSRFNSPSFQNGQSSPSSPPSSSQQFFSPPPPHSTSSNPSPSPASTSFFDQPSPSPSPQVNPQPVPQPTPQPQPKAQPMGDLLGLFSSPVSNPQSQPTNSFSSPNSFVQPQPVPLFANPMQPPSASLFSAPAPVAQPQPTPLFANPMQPQVQAASQPHYQPQPQPQPLPFSGQTYPTAVQPLFTPQAYPSLPPDQMAALNQRFLMEHLQKIPPHLQQQARAEYEAMSSDQKTTFFYSQLAQRQGQPQSGLFGQQIYPPIPLSAGYGSQLPFSPVGAAPSSYSPATPTQKAPEAPRNDGLFADLDILGLAKKK